LDYSTSSEFRKITAEAFFDQKVGLQFDCKNELVVEPLVPQVKLTYCADFVNGTVYSNGTIIFNYSILNAPNMEYWVTDLMEVEVSDGRKVYRYRPEGLKWKNGNYRQIAISGFTSDGMDGKAYTVTFRMLNYYGKVIPGSEISVAFTHKYASLPSATNSLTDCTNVLGFIGSTEDQTTPSYRFGTTLATGVPSGGLPNIGDNPDIWKLYWDDRIKERDLWFWQLGKDDTMPVFKYSEDCDPLGLKTFWKPGSQPFSFPKDEPLTPTMPGYLPLGGPNHHLPTDIPPKDLQPIYVNDDDGSEIYNHDGRWWIRTIKINPTTGKTIVTWRFKLPQSSPDDWGFDGYAHPNDGWTTFVPCYGVPVCFDKQEDGTYKPSPYTFQQPIPQLPSWGNPFVNPPGWYETQKNPYNVPSDNPSAPFQFDKIPPQRGWRKTTVPAGRDADGDPYYGRGWDPVIGPYYVDPDRGIMPSVLDSDGNPIAITIRDFEHPPCKNGGRNPGIESPKPSTPLTAQGLDDSVSVL